VRPAWLISARGCTIKVRVVRRWGPARIGYLLGLNPSTVHRGRLGTTCCGGDSAAQLTHKVRSKIRWFKFTGKW
jgi:hypothetical protein